MNWLEAKCMSPNTKQMRLGLYPWKHLFKNPPGNPVPQQEAVQILSTHIPGCKSFLSVSLTGLSLFFFSPSLPKRWAEWMWRVKAVVKFEVWLVNQNHFRSFLWSPPTLNNPQYLSDQILVGNSGSQGSLRKSLSAAFPRIPRWNVYKRCHGNPSFNQWETKPRWELWLLLLVKEGASQLKQQSDFRSRTKL